MWLHCRHCCGVWDASAPPLSAVALTGQECPGSARLRCYAKGAKSLQTPEYCGVECRNGVRAQVQRRAHGLRTPSREQTSWEIQHSFQALHQFIQHQHLSELCVSQHGAWVLQKAKLNKSTIVAQMMEVFFAHLLHQWDELHVQVLKTLLSSIWCS